MHTYYCNPNDGSYHVGSRAPNGDWSELLVTTDILLAWRIVNMLNGGPWDGNAMLYLTDRLRLRAEEEEDEE